MVEQEHSIYSPSRLKRIIGCPASINLIEALLQNKVITKEKQSSYAAEGTLNHKVLEKYYNGLSPRTLQALQAVDENAQLLIRDCADYADTIHASIGHKSSMYTHEVKVSLKDWGIPDVYGTLDYQIYDPIKGMLHVFDWKFGAGVFVSAFKNPQLLAYAAGAAGWPTRVKKITLHIVQPAIDNYDTFDLTIDELYEWVHKDLAMAILKSQSSVSEFYPDVENCRWCEAKNHCNARLCLANELAGKIFTANETLSTVPSTQDLVKLIELAPLVEDAIKGIVKYLTNELQLGRNVPGVKLVEGRSNRSWKDETSTIKWLEANTSIEELYESKLKSPAKIEAETKALKTNADFKKLFFNPPGKVTLAFEKDKRSAIKPQSDASEVFKEVSGMDILE